MPKCDSDLTIVAMNYPSSLSEFTFEKRASNSQEQINPQLAGIIKNYASERQYGVDQCMPACSVAQLSLKTLT